MAETVNCKPGVTSSGFLGPKYESIVMLASPLLGPELASAERSIGGSVKFEVDWKPGGVGEGFMGESSAVAVACSDTLALETFAANQEDGAKITIVAVIKDAQEPRNARMVPSFLIGGRGLPGRSSRTSFGSAPKLAHFLPRDLRPQYKNAIEKEQEKLRNFPTSV